MYKLKLLRFIAVLVLGIIYLTVIPVLWGDSPFILTIVIQASIFAIAALGVWLCFTVGLTNIAQAVFLAIGGYTTAILSTKLGLSFWLCLPIAGLVAAFIGFFLGSVTRWLKGIYFGILTFVLNEIMRHGMMLGGDLTGGTVGIGSIPRPDSISIGGWTIIPQFAATDRLLYFYLAAFLLIISIAVVWRLSRCRIGRMNDALRQNDKLAATVGINIVKYRLITFCVSCFLGGIGGAFFAGYTTVILPVTYNLLVSVYLAIYCVCGGLGYIAGPILGAFFFQALFPFLSALHDYQAIIYAVMMIAVILWMPNGVLSLRFRRKKVAKEEIYVGTTTQGKQGG